MLLADDNATFKGLINKQVPPALHGAGEHWVWMSSGTGTAAKELTINVSGFDPLTVEFDKHGIKIEPQCTYILRIKVPDKGGKLDLSDSKTLFIKVFPPDANLYWNKNALTLKDGMVETTIYKGISYYTVDASKYYTIENAGLNFDDVNDKDTFKIELKPKMGELIVRTTPSSATVYVDGKLIDNSSSEPIELQVGEHQVRVEAKKYATMEKKVNIELGKPSTEPFTLTELNTFKFTSNPSEAEILIGDESIGTTPCTTENYTPGTYTITALKKGYLKKVLNNYTLDTEEVPIITLLKAISFYAEGNFKAGTFMGFGATVGTYIYNINAEVAYLIGSGKSETIYWSGNNTPPIGCTYTPSTNFTFKLGYGIPLSNRYRLTPQVGVGLVKLKESIEEGNGSSPADGANSMMGLVGVRFSAAIANHFGVSVSPEFGFSMQKSKGFEALSAVSSDIKKWGEGFNVKLGLTVTF